VRCMLAGTVGARPERPKLIHSVPGPKLTTAEARVLRHVAAGFSNDEIAESLGVSTNTVRTHVQRVTGKLGADSRLRAVALARESGVLDLPPTSAIGP
jgi:DNA-binding CsgD family transcriptional regulator